MTGVGVGVTNRDYYGLMPTRKDYMDQVSKLCKRVKFLEREMQMLKSRKFEEEMSHSEKEEDLDLEAPIMPNIKENNTSKDDTTNIPEVNIILSYYSIVSCACYKLVFYQTTCSY